MSAFRFIQGQSPLLLSIPHSGTALPAGLHARLSPAARPLPDTDWHVDRLYAFAESLGLSVLVADLSRLVVDLNRPPDDAALYPGQAGTGVVPRCLFDGQAAWVDEIDENEQAARIDTWWRPYHAALSAELERLRDRFGYALLWDAHSISPQVPRLFDGRLPHLNLGTHEGRACDPAAQALVASALQSPAFSSVVNGRFKGGYITRHYGNPAQGLHAVQLEIAWDAYLDDDLVFRPDRAAPLVGLLRPAMEAFRDWRPAR